MDSEVDPAADALWATTGFVSDKTGVHDKTPHTDAEWTAARHNALILIEATNLLRMEGRKVAERALEIDMDLGKRFVIAAEAPMEMSGRMVMVRDGKVVPTADEVLERSPRR